MTHDMGRRKFLQVLGIGAGAAGVAALNGTKTLAQEDHTGHEVASAAGAPAAQTSEQPWLEMDAHHKEGVDAFLANIGTDPLYWNRLLEYELDGDVKVFTLEASNIDWETNTGMVIPAMAYNGIVPGPEIRVTEGDKIRINFTNNLTSESTAIHFHGLYVPNAVDGVPFITQPVVQPGETFTYEFTVRNSGSHMYHSHHNSAAQVPKGLLGAFIVEPADKSREPAFDADYTMILNDSALGFTLNGKQFPNTQPIVAKLGDKVRIRYMNEGLMIHPMHLHGLAQLVITKDGWPLPAPYMCDTLNIAPGERYDVIVDCTDPGVWAFHCHILSHAEGPMGMFGMVTVMIVEE